MENENRYKPETLAETLIDEATSKLELVIHSEDLKQEERIEVEQMSKRLRDIWNDVLERKQNK